MQSDSQRFTPWNAEHRNQCVCGSCQMTWMTFKTRQKYIDRANAVVVCWIQSALLLSRD